MVLLQVLVLAFFILSATRPISYEVTEKRHLCAHAHTQISVTSKCLCLPVVYNEQLRGFHF